MNRESRRRLLVAALVVVSLAVSGCLTLDPTVTANTADSAVFENVSVNESWSTGRVRATVSLSSNPRAGNVTQLTVVTKRGKTYTSATIDPGQTSAVLEFPVHRNATLVASDTINGTTIEKLNVTTSGNKII